MLADLRTRFEGFNEITKAFDCIYDVLTMSEATLIEKARALADLYGRPSGELISQLRLFRTVMKAKDKIFDSFAQMAKYQIYPYSNQRECLQSPSFVCCYYSGDAICDSGL